MEAILLLEDDPSFGYILSEYLKMKAFSVTWVKSAELALQAIERNTFQLAILDIMLPGMDGFELATIIKQENPQLPFIFLSAKSLKIDQLKGFQLGAFDYITKPVDEELLVAKIKALLAQQRKPIAEKQTYSIGDYTFLPATFQLQHGTSGRKLTAREAELLQLLCRHQGTLLSRKKALLQIWGSNDEFSRKSMDVFISRLRKYLSADARISIENVHSKGFILHVP
jgi:DNA-binding response OmpR family regulator